jgi:hypothetical protein
MQRCFIAFVLVTAVAMIVVWIASYQRPLYLYVTLHERYVLSVDSGRWQWIVATYSRIVGRDASSVPIVETDARRIGAPYVPPQFIWPLHFAQWPCVQRGVSYKLTFVPYVASRGEPVVIQTAKDGFSMQIYAMPCWVPLAVFTAGELLILWRLDANIRAGRRNVGRCLICGYDLRATPDRCPECGTVPGNPTS